MVQSAVLPLWGGVAESRFRSVFGARVPLRGLFNPDALRVGYAIRVCFGGRDGIRDVGLAGVPSMPCDVFSKEFCELL